MLGVMEKDALETEIGVKGTRVAESAGQPGKGKNFKGCTCVKRAWVSWVLSSYRRLELGSSACLDHIGIPSSHLPLILCLLARENTSRELGINNLVRGSFFFHLSRHAIRVESSLTFPC